MEANKFTNSLITLCCVLSIVGCVDKPDVTEPPLNEPTTVEQTLENLGVDIEQSDRLNSDGESLPEDYTPLGASHQFEKYDELTLVGWALNPSSGYSSQLTLMELDRQNDNLFTADVLFAPEVNETTWAESVGDSPDYLRAVSAGDIDGDGLEEMVAVYYESATATAFLLVAEDQPNRFEFSEPVSIYSGALTEINLAMGDFNGDGFSEPVIGLVDGDKASLLWLSNDAGTLSTEGHSLDVSPAYLGSDVSLRLSAGNVDYDPSSELAIVVNETYVQSDLTGHSRVLVFDDAKASFSALLEERVHASAINRTAIVADVSLGDIDGDNVSEIVLGGLTNFDNSAQCEFNQVHWVLDDRVNEFKEITSHLETFELYNGCAKTPGKLRFVHINTGDLDGDGIAEIQANQFIFDDLSISSNLMPLIDENNEQAALPESLLFRDASGFYGLFDAHTSDILIADVTANKRQEVVTVSHDSKRFEVWGLGDPSATLGAIDKEWRLIHSQGLDASISEINRPALLARNINHDGVAISYDEGDYQLIFTEPIVMAALAAAPCYEDKGQNLDACRTSYGTTQTSQVSFDQSLTVKAGVIAGVSVELSDPITALRISEIEGVAKTTASVSLMHSASYQYAEQVEYTTGPLEDTVVFSTIPYDVYTYTITSHPNASLMGEKLVVSLPRSPVTLQVERSFYNANVVHGGPQIDESVFQHTVGDPNTYTTAAQKDQILAAYDFFDFDTWGFEHGPATVGEGGGNTTLDINVAQESGFGVGVGLDFEFEMKATAGVVVGGFTVGVSTESAFQIIHGEESNYTGTVANLPPEHFAQNYYDWGLFTYTHDSHSSGQHFEVINYWVE